MTERRDLAAAWLAELAAPLAEQARALPDLEQRLEAMITASRTRWPGIELDPERFVKYVARRIPPDVPRLHEALDQLHGEDLYLACACCEAVPAAVARFHAEYLPAIDRALGKMAGIRRQIEDVRQRIVSKLLVAERDRPAKLASYGGRGHLQNWIRATTIREAIDVLREQRKDARVDESMLDAIPTPADDPELHHLKIAYRDAFATAFARAFETLSVRERVILRCRYVDGVQLPALAALYRVDRATVVRWLAAIRARLFEHTRQHMTETLGLTSETLTSVLRLIHSMLDASITTQLRAAHEQAS